jgi:hypothetical protein
MKKKIIKVTHKSALILAVTAPVLLCLFVLLAFIANVPTNLEAADVAVFQNDLNFTPLQHPKTFADEITAIKTIQHRVFAVAPVGAGIPEFEPREPSDLMKKREGLCFDRSRTLDKAFDYIGLPARHVYLLYRQDRGFWSAMFHYGQASHAITEVKTSKGWMFIDSNTEWIALTRDGQVVNADDVWKRATEFDAMPAYLKDSWWAIRGMYSRKGQLYPPYILFPDFNWMDFFSWLIRG